MGEQIQPKSVCPLVVTLSPSMIHMAMAFVARTAQDLTPYQLQMVVFLQQAGILDPLNPYKCVQGCCLDAPIRPLATTTRKPKWMMEVVRIWLLPLTTTVAPPTILYGLPTVVVKLSKQGSREPYRQ